MTVFAYKLRNKGLWFTKSKFKYHPVPRDDELLSSWLVRTALAHLTDPATFVNLYLSDWRNILWTRDIDVYADRKLLEALSLKSSLDYRVLYAMTLRSYEGYLAETITYKTRNKFIQPLGNYSRLKIKYGLRFCPKCLNQEETPYFRKKWRLSFSTACIIHNCFLYDRCPVCRASITLCRSYLDYRFPCCHECGADFSSSRVEHIDATSYGLKAIRYLYQVLDTGLVSFGDKHTYSFLFFMVLNQLMKVISFWKRNKGLFEHEVMAKVIGQLRDKKRHAYLTDLSLKEQYLCFSAVMRLFENFPDGLLDFCSQNRIGKTELTRDLKYIPYWYGEVVNICSKWGNKIGLEEVGGKC